MLPISNSIDLTEDFEISLEQTLTYKVHFDRERIAGEIDKTEAVAQALKMRFLTEKFIYPIFSWEYGLQTLDLRGQPVNYVESELKRRIREEGIKDSRVTDIYDFKFESEQNKVTVSFTVSTIYGTTFPGTQEVII